MGEMRSRETIVGTRREGGDVWNHQTRRLVFVSGSIPKSG